MDTKKEIPVLLLTGYLGSGKTTLLNKILSNKRNIRFAVIVNDIGEVNIDASLIQKDGIVGVNDDSLVALQNGCICCTLKTDLVRQLTDIANTGKFDYIVIEASGICEPEPIAGTICSIQYITGNIVKDYVPKLDCIVTVVDALRLKDEFSCAKDLLRGNLKEDDLESLVIEQVEFCNKILLNKSSMVTREERNLVRSIIRKLQPEAEIIECDWCDVDFDRILNTGLFNLDEVAGSATWVQEIEGGMEDEEDGEADEYGISTYVYSARAAFDMNRFDDFVTRLWPSGVIRAKGLCYFEDNRDMCYIFEQAGSQISLKEAGRWYATMPEEELKIQLERDPILRRDWDPEYGDRMQKLVFIGRNLDRDSIRSSLDFALSDK